MSAELPSSLHRVGLTGGVGAGKSTVAELLRRAGVVVIDMDQLGRELIDGDPAVTDWMSRRFGSHIVVGGKVDRKQLRTVVFNDPNARKELEGFLHPRIRARFAEAATAAASRGSRLVVAEAALLIETGRFREMDELIVVLAPEAARIARVTARDHIPEALGRQIMAAQVDDDTRRRVATETLVNDGPPEKLEAQIERLVARWRKQGWLPNPTKPG